MKNQKILLALVLVLGFLFSSSTAYAARGHLVDVGLTGGDVIVLVDWDEDGTWDDSFPFDSIEEAEAFLQANDL